MMKCFLLDNFKFMNPFENPKNLINNELLEKIDSESKESPLTFSEEIREAKKIIAKLNIKQKSLLDELDKKLDLMDNDRNNFLVNQQSVMDTHLELNGVVTELEFEMRKIESLKLDQGELIASISSTATKN